MSEYNNTPGVEAVLPDPTDYNRLDDESARSVASDTGVMYYIYAVVRPKAGHTSLTLPAEGVLPQVAVSALSYQNLLAIISPIPEAECNADTLQAYMQDLEWLQDRVLAHQNVLVSLLDGYTMVPLQLFTLYYTEHRILDMLSQRYSELNATLDRLEGATEWGVKLFCDLPALIRWTENSSEELRPMRETMARASSGAAYLLRKKMNLATQNAARQIKVTSVRTSHQELSALARDALTSPVQSPEIHGQPAEMILNGAYLVDDNQRDTFMSTLAHMEQACVPQGLRYELTGPWPPYSFARPKTQGDDDA